MALKERLLAVFRSINSIDKSKFQLEEDVNYSITRRLYLGSARVWAKNWPTIKQFSAEIYLASSDALGQGSTEENSNRLIS